MKAVLGEYGKVILFTVVMGVLLLFLFGGGDTGFLGLLGGARPEASVGDADSFEIAETIFTRKTPKVFVSVKKLKKGQEYDLLDAGIFQIRAEGEDADSVEVSVVKVLDPEKNEVTDSEAPQKFFPVKAGGYYVTYRAEEIFCGSRRQSEKEYCFLVE